MTLHEFLWLMFLFLCLMWTRRRCDKGYTRTMFCCYLIESFMFEPFGHFKIVQFGKSVSFDVSIFLLLCIAYFVSNWNAGKSSAGFNAKVPATSQLYHTQAYTQQHIIWSQLSAIKAWVLKYSRNGNGKRDVCARGCFFLYLKIFVCSFISVLNWRWRIERNTFGTVENQFVN